MQSSDDHLVGRLPQHVLSAIQNGNKIAAIKSLREQYNIDLKQAKYIVDEYISENGDKETEEPQSAGWTIERLILGVILIAVLYGLYDLLMK